MQPGVTQVYVCVIGVSGLSGLNQILSTHLESPSHPVQMDETPTCQKIKTCLVDAGSELKTDLISVARGNGERRSAPPLPARADQGRGRLVLEP